MSSHTRPRTTALAVIFAVSGFAGLIYESVWAAYLKLFLGHAAYAQAIVLIVFVGGLALGAAVVGWLGPRIRHPLLAYCVVEAAIGVLAIAFHSVYLIVTDWAYATLIPAVCSPQAACAAPTVIAALLILPASILLGATFPLMTVGVLRAVPGRVGSHISLLYFANSLGAVLGVLASGFILIPWLGLPGTILTAGLVNFGVAIAVYEAQKSLSQRVVPSAPLCSDRSHRADGGNHVTILFLVATITGATSFMYEVLWTRMLGLVLGVSTHSFELMLAAFIFGLAMGSLWVRRRIDNFTHPIAALAVIQVLMGAFAVATLPIYSMSFDAMAHFARASALTWQGYNLYLVFSALLASSVMLPAAFLAGMTLPLVTKLLLAGPQGERAIGLVYGANTLGSIVGVILCVNFMMPLLGLRHALLMAGLVDAALGLWLLRLAPLPVTVRRRVGATVLGAGMLLAISGATELDPLKLASGVYRTGVPRASEGSKLMFHRDGKTATVDVLRTPKGLLVLHTNGKPDASLVASELVKQDLESDEGTQVLLAALPLLHVPHARDAAVIGFGSGMTTTMLLGSDKLDEVVTIEIESAMVEGSREFLPRTARAHDDPRSRIVIDDAKAWFSRSGKHFDIIVSEPSNPWVSGVSSLFSTEFYRHVASRLNDGGVFVQWVQTYEFDGELLASALSALSANFEHFVVYEANAGDLVLVASNAAQMPPAREDVLEFSTLASELQRIGVRALNDFARLRLADDRHAAGVIASFAVPPNSDFFPFIDQHASRARFMRRSAHELRTFRLAPVPVDGWGPQDVGIGPLSTPRPSTEPIEMLSRVALAERNGAFIRALTMKSKIPMPTSETTAAVATIFGSCTSPAVADVLWDRVVLFAAETVPLVARVDAESMAAALANSNCVDGLTKVHRDWLWLFSAVAQRNAVTVTNLARSMLSGEVLSTAQHEYVVAAAGYAMVAVGDLSGLAELVSTQRLRLPPATRGTGWWRYLESRGGSPLGNSGL